MNCDKEILLHFFEDLKKSVLPLIISYHYTRSVTVRSSTRQEVHACWPLSTSTSWTSWPLKKGPNGYPKILEWNYHFILCTIPEDTRSQNMFYFSVFPSGECQMVEYKCVLWQSQKTLSRRVNSHDLPGQGIVPASPIQHLCSRPKSSFIPKNQQTRNFRLLITHKQNPQTEINQLAVTAKILS